MTSLHTYKIIYKDDEQRPQVIGQITVFQDGNVTVSYLGHGGKRYPAFITAGSDYSINPLWMRVPSNIRREQVNKISAFDKFVEIFAGRLATDRFEFRRA